MLQVLLVDDEPFILQGLAMLIDWEKEGFTDVYKRQHNLRVIFTRTASPVRCLWRP